MVLAYMYGRTELNMKETLKTMFSMDMDSWNIETTPGTKVSSKMANGMALALD